MHRTILKLRSLRARAKQERVALAIALCGVSMLTAIGLFALVSELAYRAADDLGQQRARNTAAQISSELVRVETSLAVLADGESAKTFNADVFEAEARGIRKRTSAQAVWIARRVDESERPAYEARLGGPLTHVRPDARFTPAPQLPVNYPVFYASPKKAMQTLIGADVLRLPGVEYATLRSLISGEVFASQPRVQGFGRAIVYVVPVPGEVPEYVDSGRVRNIPPRAVALVGAYVTGDAILDVAVRQGRNPTELLVNGRRIGGSDQPWVPVSRGSAESPVGLIEVSVPRPPVEWTPRIIAIISGLVITITAIIATALFIRGEGRRDQLERADRRSSRLAEERETLRALATMTATGAPIERVLTESVERARVLFGADAAYIIAECLTSDADVEAAPDVFTGTAAHEHLTGGLAVGGPATATLSSSHIEAIPQRQASNGDDPIGTTPQDWSQRHREAASTIGGERGARALAQARELAVSGFAQDGVGPPSSAWESTFGTIARHRIHVAGEPAGVFTVVGGDAPPERTQAVMSDIGRLVSATLSVEGARSEAASRRELDRLKSSIVDAVTHELRSPLTAMNGHLQLMDQLDDDADPAARHELLAVVMRNEARLRALVDDLIALGEHDASTIPASVLQDHVDLCQIARAVIVDFPAEEGAPIAIELQRRPICVQGDARAITHLITNLVSNARKFTPRDGRITVSVSEELAGAAVLEIDDTGRGVPEEDRGRVFDRFFQGQGEGSRPGMGLGLAVVRAIADSHHANVSIGEGRTGVGTSVRVVFPPIATRSQR